MLVSVHIPKCAGTSFRTLLRSYYRERVWENYGRIFAREQAEPGMVPAGTCCIHGHFLADAFDDLFPERELITWLRHPVERVISTYYHFLRTPDFRDDCCRALYANKLSLTEFAELDWMRNTASRYMAGKSAEEFAFIGIVEEFGESLLQFNERFGVGQSMPIPKNNVNPARALPSNELSADDFAHILSRNATDVWWYQQAKAHLRRGQERRNFSPVVERVVPAVALAEAGTTRSTRLPGSWWPTPVGRSALA